MKKLALLLIATFAALPTSAAQQIGDNYQPYYGDKPRQFTQTFHNGGFHVVGEFIGFCDGTQYFSGQYTMYSDYVQNNECGGPDNGLGPLG